MRYCAETDRYGLPLSRLASPPQLSPHTTSPPPSESASKSHQSHTSQKTPSPEEVEPGVKADQRSLNSALNTYKCPKVRNGFAKATQYARFFGGDLRLISMDGYGTGVSPLLLVLEGSQLIAVFRRLYLAESAFVEVSLALLP